MRVVLGALLAVLFLVSIIVVLLAAARSVPVHRGFPSAWLLLRGSLMLLAATVGLMFLVIVITLVAAILLSAGRQGLYYRLYIQP